ncbi:MAG: glycoside hydrolase family 3 C-terminal domain-containing protein, partial [Bacteroidota bacterium]
GVNLNCGSTFDPHLLEAVQMGLISEEEIDERLATLLSTRFKLGLFDPYERNPYAEISTDVINSEAHQKLAREVAQKSIVVLKNDQVLPLAKDTRSVFVLGPNANNVEVLIGNYYGVSPNMSTILEGLASKVAPGCMIQYKKGFMLDRPNINPIDWTSPDAKQADVSIMVMGISPMIEGEEGEAIASPHKGDRLDYNLPSNQIEFLKRMREDNDKPIIAVITGGSPMNLKEVHEIADAVVLAWYPGEQGGNAVADIIFGDVNPSGRLPITFPESIDQLPPFDDYDMPGRTYRYMSAKPMYPFGYGLSYTDFRYEDVTINSNELQAGETAEVTVTVKNIGRYDGEEVVQLYLTLPDKGYQNPLYSLKGFKRIALQPGESKEVSFTLTPDLMESVTMEGEFVIEQGEYLVKVGGSSPHERSLELGMPGFAETQFTVSK